MKNMLNYIEDKDILINDNWFYHATEFNRDNYINILNNGILSPYLLPNNNSLYQYVFVSRVNNNSKYSAFANHSIYPNFIINDSIAAIKAEDSLIKKIIYGGFHGINFTSWYDDEYQVYKKIKPEDIVGILFNLERMITNYEDKANYYFNILFDLVTLLNELKITIPILDYYTGKEINKQKVLTLEKYKKDIKI